MRRTTGATNSAQGTHVVPPASSSAGGSHDRSVTRSRARNGARGPASGGQPSVLDEALRLDARELLFRHVARGVDAAEARVARLLDLRVALLNRVDQVLERLVHDAVRSDLVRDLLGAAVLRDELVLRGHVDAVDARMAQRWRDGGEVDAARAGAARELHDLPRRVAAHDRVVHQQHVLALELELDG